MQDLTGTGCSTNTVQGIDVSDDQGTINWSQVAASGRSFAYAKATQGNYYQASTFAANWAGMKAAGVIRGAYHFVDGTVNGTAQADYFLDYIGGGVANPFAATDLPPMLDWECNAASCYGGGTSPPVSAAAYATVVQDFIAEVLLRTGKTTLIYTYQSFWTGLNPPGAWQNDPLDFAWPNSGCPPVPAPWTTWTVWQWDVLGSGQVPGVNAACDVDVFNGTLAQLTQFAGGGGTSCANPVLGSLGGGGPITGGACGTQGAPTVPTGCGSVPSGDGLAQGDAVSSCDGRFSLAMQADGNVVLYDRGKALWSTGTNATGGFTLAMQTDGNLVVYTSAGCPVWASDTSGNPGASLAVQSDGNLVIYTSAGKAIWATGTGPIPEPPSTCGTFTGGEGMGYNDIVSACGACFTLIFQDDGNLVLYKTSQFLQAAGVVWDSGTSGTGYLMSMGTDGNLNIYSSSGCSVWSTNTSGNTGATLAVQDDGNLVIYSSAGAALWNSASVTCSGGCNCAPIPQQPSNDAISVVNWADGHSELFAKTPGGDLDHSWDGAAAGKLAWATPAQLDTGADCGTSAGYWDLHPEVFSPLASDTTGHLWWNATNGWNGYQAFGGTDITHLAALLWPDGHEEVFGLGGDGSTWHNWFSTTAGWSGWGSLGGANLASGPGAIVWGDGHAELFALDASGDLWHSWSGTGAAFPGGWAAWAQLATPIAMASKPVPVRWPDGHVELFVRGSDNQLYHSNFSTTSGWPTFSVLSAGYAIVGEPSAIMNPSSIAEVFARDSTGNVVHTFGNGTTYSTFSSLGNVISAASDPFGWIRGDGNAEVFAVDGSGDLVQIYRDPTTNWGSWSAIGSGFDSCAPALPVLDGGLPDAGEDVPDAGTEGTDAGLVPDGGGLGGSPDAGSTLGGDGGFAGRDAGSSEPDAGHVAPDAGSVKPDGGSTTEPDADAGSQPNPIDDSSGCGCGVGGSGPGEAGLMLFVLAAIATGRRRRR
jgi:MYXO-CTERM domain-containing protein